jgi:hypothetical protein
LDGKSACQSKEAIDRQVHRRVFDTLVKPKFKPRSFRHFFLRQSRAEAQPAHVPSNVAEHRACVLVEHLPLAYPGS